MLDFRKNYFDIRIKSQNHNEPQYKKTKQTCLIVVPQATFAIFSKLTKIRILKLFL